MDNPVCENFGFNIFGSPVETVLEYAANHGLRHIELNLTREHSAPDSFTDQRVLALTEFTAIHGIDLSIHLPGYINVAEIIPLFRRANIRYLMRSIELAAALNARHITAHIGTFYWFPVRQWMRRKGLDRFLRSMDTITPVLERWNVCLALENVVPIPYGSEYLYLGDNLTDFHYLFQRLPEARFRFCLDTGHAHIGEGVIPYIQALGHRLATVHYHDNRGANDEHLPVGEGTVPWPAVAAELIRLQYRGPLISECRRVRPHESSERLRKHLLAARPAGSAA